jgi:hypothetical protein
VRVINNVVKHCEVKPKFYETFQQEGSATEFPYRQKVVLLFQQQDGVDVCLYCMYVQEYGAGGQRARTPGLTCTWLQPVLVARQQWCAHAVSLSGPVCFHNQHQAKMSSQHSQLPVLGQAPAPILTSPLPRLPADCPAPNTNVVYLSYIDSVKYFQPEITVPNGSGGTMALRTFVYHQILLGYLDFVKKLGFEHLYIWACPPLQVRSTAAHMAGQLLTVLSYLWQRCLNLQLWKPDLS